MKANTQTFKTFLTQTRTSFVIPIYQRNYNWTHSQCMDFIKDIETLILDSKIPVHFLGTIVFVRSSDIDIIESDFNELIIIDGQQRITTSILYLKAIYDLLGDEDLDLKDEISEEYFKIKRSKKLKLILNKEDNKVFFNLINNLDLSKEDKKSIVYSNYKFILDYLSKSNIDLNKYFRLFRKLEIVYIDLDREKDNPQLIFENINSTGLDLTQADLIRNFILMDKDSTEQLYFYDNYWFKIEQSLGIDNVSMFIRDFLTMKKNKIHKESDVYSAFKDYVYEEKMDFETLLSDLLYYSKIYSYFLNNYHDDKDIDIVIKEFNNLNVKVIMPLLLKMFEDFDKNVISKETLLKSMKMIISYIFRIIVFGNPTNGLNSLFSSLYKELLTFKDYKENYYERLSSILLLKSGNVAFLKNIEVKSNLFVRDMYNSKFKKYFLYSLEKYNNKELINFDSLSIEHIMPQTLTTRWEIDLGTNFLDTYEKRLHTIGNLTLTGYNSELSNKPFSYKKEMFKESNIKLNKYFDNVTKWDDEEIKKRTVYIYELFKKIWEYPDIDNKFLEKNIKDFYSLEDTVNTTNKTLSKIEILGEEIIVKKYNWTRLFIALHKYLYELDKTHFKNSLASNVSYIGNSNNNFREVQEIDTDVYLETHGSSSVLFKYMKQSCEYFDFEGEDVKFYIK